MFLMVAGTSLFCFVIASLAFLAATRGAEGKANEPAEDAGWPERFRFVRAVIWIVILLMLVGAGFLCQRLLIGEVFELRNKLTNS
jgi:hypothetical protein